MMIPRVQDTAGTTRPTGPFQELEVDTWAIPVDIVRGTTHQLAHVFVARCVLSRYIFAFPMKTTAAAEWIPLFRTNVLQVCGHALKLVRSDRAKAFQGEAVEALTNSTHHKFGWNFVEETGQEVLPAANAHTAIAGGELHARTQEWFSTK